MADGNTNLRGATREQVWEDLRTVARPDSRFGWDFSSFIPDYEDSNKSSLEILERGEVNNYKSWFVTPDNNLNTLRERLIENEESFIMPTYGIRRGFLRLEPEDVPEGQAAFASTLDGMTEFGTRIELETMEDVLDELDCMVTGASFVTSDGLRMGKGHGFFDLEWAIMRNVGLANEQTDVVAVVHDIQVVEDQTGRDIAADHDTIVDAIVTPTQEIRIDDAPSKPEGIHWPLLTRKEVERMPPLSKLWNRAGMPELQ